ncbi:heat shock protein Hsp18 [Clostridium aciditolerans]|uniref:Hsp20/alpha crystallin family protein n=1 Tax=Clostridium aciditolerans TaxID=339861 RepID=A0A934I067_9CLOT|nr:heat shock protein Hsp18 [Clostridium aciditolerans]MBI6874404.1 Hsp20/alpha crystallin family protein [Clostridium aciditolerans]
MFDMVPFRKNDLVRRDDFFSPFLKNFFNDDFFSTINDLRGNFKVDLKETDENYLVEADLPGIEKEAIDIEFNNNYLVISAKRNESLEDKKENYVRRERHYGEFKRSFYIDNVDESKIDASFEHGVLKITLPKLNKGNDKKRKIDIR